MPTCTGCEAGIRMCETRPCWGTPQEIEAIQKAGFGDRLTRDWWTGTEYIYLLAPAIKGYEGKNAPEYPRGRCTFLMDDKRCELHDMGLKPTEGKGTCCKGNAPNSSHEDMAMSWREFQHQAVL